MSPAEWPADAGHEWCPPGHGDLYPAMLGTGEKQGFWVKVGMLRDENCLSRTRLG